MAKKDTAVNGKKNKRNKADKNTAPAQTTEETVELAPEEDEEDSLFMEEAEEEEDISDEKMSASDNSEESEGEESEEKRLRGARQVYFDCCGVVTLPEDLPSRKLLKGDEAVVADSLSMTMPDDAAAKPNIEKGREEVIALFTEKYGVKPEIVNGPYYIYKGTGIRHRTRETLNSSIHKDAKFTGERARAVHRLKGIEWQVTVNCSTNPDAVYVFYDAISKKDIPADADPKMYQKPSPRWLPLKSLRDIRKID